MEKRKVTAEEKRMLMESLERPDIKEFDEGEVIFGTVHNIKPTTVKDKQKQGEFTEVDLIVFDMDIEDEEPKRVGIWKGTVLDKHFKRLDVQPGDYIAIQYYGKEKSEGGKNYENFGVEKL